MSRVEWHDANEGDGIGCLGFVVLLLAAPAAWFLAGRVAGLTLAGAALVMLAIAHVRNDRQARRPARPLADTGDAQVACARAHFERRWIARLFEVIARRHTKRHIELDVEVGSPRAFATIVIGARDGRLVDLTFTPKPGVRDRYLAREEAIAIARAARPGPWPGELRASQEGETFVVSARPEGLRGGGTVVDLHAVSGLLSTKQYVLR